MHEPPSARTASVAQRRAARKDLLVCFSHLRWDFVFQRPQHLLSRAATTYDVLFFEEPMFDDVARPVLRQRAAGFGVRVATPILPSRLSRAEQIEAQRALLEFALINAENEAFLFWYYTPMALEFSGDFPPDLCVYDCMDELSLFRNAPDALTDLETALLARADLVFTGGRSLYESKRLKRSNVHCFPSSVDRAHFAKALDYDLADPDDQARIARPRVGFFGVIDERMDLDLVDAVAQLRPQLQFVMLGPVVKIDPATLPQRPNLHWLGQKSYDELPAYLAHWSAGFMPFALNDATRYISPTKTPEFLAAGLPLVSTPVADVVEPYGREALVAIADRPDVMAAEIDALLARSSDERSIWTARAARRLSRMSWDRTWTDMAKLMDEALGGEDVDARVRA